MKKRRGYFKHYNDASVGESLAVLARRKEYLSICLFWHSLEILNQKNTNTATIFIESLSLLYNARKRTIIKSYQAISDVTDTFDFNYNNSKLTFSIANYSEYQESRGKKSSKKSAKKVPIKDKRLKIKDKRLNICSAREQEIQFDADFQKSKKLLTEKYELRYLSPHVPEIYKFFSSTENLKDWLKSLHTADKIKNLDWADVEQRAVIKRYISAALKKEVGLV